MFSAANTHSLDFAACLRGLETALFARLADCVVLALCLSALLLVCCGLAGLCAAAPRRRQA